MTPEHALSRPRASPRRCYRPTAGAAVEFTQRASRVTAQATGANDQIKRTEEFGSWSESVPASGGGNCPEGGTWSASGYAEQSANAAFGPNSGRVTATGTITGSGTSQCPATVEPFGGGEFSTAVRFSITNAPMPYTATGTLGPGEGQYVSVILGGPNGEVFRVEDKVGDYSFNGKLPAGDYFLQFQELLSGQSVNSSSSLDFRVGGSPAKCEGAAVTIFTGDAGPDTINGTSGADVINGEGGKDLISGLNGNDRICGSGADDTLLGGSTQGGSGDGKDRLFGGGGDDALDGGGQRDWLFGFTGKDKLFGRSGRDLLDGGDGRDDLDGGGADDKLRGGPGKRDVLRGGPGGDNLSGGPGDLDKCIGGPGTDTADNSCEIISGIELVGLN